MKIRMWVCTVKSLGPGLYDGIPILLSAYGSCSRNSCVVNAVPRNCYDFFPPIANVSNQKGKTLFSIFKALFEYSTANLVAEAGMEAG